ncbi:MAG: hypothetical protein NVS4B3_09250 [Gemmatimonadaceae bacterium]
MPTNTEFLPSPLVDRVYSITSAGVTERNGTRRFHLLFVDGALVLRTLESEAVLDTLDADLRLFVAESATDHLFVHAGVVGWRGRALVLPGASTTGKTSLIHALLRAGATYYSDDCALLDAQGRVHAFPVPLSIRGDAGTRARKLRAEVLGAVTGIGPLPLGLIAFTRYRAGASRRPRALPSGAAILELLRHTVATQRQPGRSLSTLARAVEGVGVVKGPRGEAAEYAELLIQMMPGTEAALVH